MTKVIWRDFGLKKIGNEVTRFGFERILVGVVGHKAQEMNIDGRLTNAEVAAINFYGTDDGHIPPRDFLVKPLQEGRRVVRLIMKPLAMLLRQSGGGVSAAEVLEEAGRGLAGIVRNAIIGGRGIRPPNAPATVAKKGFNHPLVWSYALAEAISYRLGRRSGDVVEAGAAVGDYEAFEYSGGGE